MLSLSRFLDEVTMSQYDKPRNTEVRVLDVESGDYFTVDRVYSERGKLLVEINLSTDVVEEDDENEDEDD